MRSAVEESARPNEAQISRAKRIATRIPKPAALKAYRTAFFFLVRDLLTTEK